MSSNVQMGRSMPALRPILPSVCARTGAEKELGLREAGFRFVWSHGGIRITTISPDLMKRGLSHSTEAKS